MQGRHNRVGDSIKYELHIEGAASVTISVATLMDAWEDSFPAEDALALDTQIGCTAILFFPSHRTSSHHIAPQHVMAGIEP